MIDTKTDRKDLYLKLDKIDYVTKLKPLLEQKGYKLRLEDGKFVPRNTACSYDVPWVYVKTTPEARCDIYQTVFHQIFKHVHSFCRECYKVVVRPRTLEELFDLYELERELDVPCKCGIERRDTVHGLYGGYFYNRGIKEGLERYKQVRELVNEKISTETPVILKRYCTEYEIGEKALGPSNEMPDITTEEREWEITVESLIPRVGFGTRQTDYQIAHVMRDWIHYAYKNGDETYKLFTGGSPLFQKYVTYHEE